AGGFGAVNQRAECTAGDSADEGEDERLKQKRGLDVQPGEAEDTEDADVFAALTDGGEHRVHDAKHAAERHDGSDDHDGDQKLPVRLREVVEIFCLGEGLHGGFFVFVVEVIL